MKNCIYMCLNCFRLFDNKGTCCNIELYSIPKKVRPPKETDNTKAWKIFIQLFLNKKATKKQLGKIIELRELYGLNTMQEKLCYAAIKDNDLSQMAYLDMKKEYTICVSKFDNAESKQFVNDIDDFILKSDKQYNIKKFNLNKKYFLVPIHGFDGLSIFFSTQIEKYKIYKVIVSYSSSYNCHSFKIASTEYFKSDFYDMYFESNVTSFLNTDDTIRQHFLIFKYKEHAMTFRMRYLNIIIPYFKNNNKEIVKYLLKEYISDYNIISRKYPELII